MQAVCKGTLNIPSESIPCLAGEKGLHTRVLHALISNLHDLEVELRRACAQSLSDLQLKNIASSTKC